MPRNIIEWLYFRQPGNLAYYDRLTQLLNRNWWEIYAKQKLNKKNLYITIIDLDNLKEVNDTEGHLAGDSLIINFSNALKQYFPKAKLVRLGGDEFLIISDISPKNDIYKLKHFEPFNFSFGLYYKDKEVALTDALKQADKEMYLQKQWRKPYRNIGV